MLKTLVNQGVKLGFASLVEPNSISVDIKPIMIGAMIDTNAIGVVKVEVRQTKRKHYMRGGSVWHIEDFLFCKLTDTGSRA